MISLVIVINLFMSSIVLTINVLVVNQEARFSGGHPT